MELRQCSSESSAQKETSLPNEEYKRYLFWTRDVAKNLVRELDKEHRWEKYSWTQVALDKKHKAIEDVNAFLAKENIQSVPGEIVEKRLQKVIKDSQRGRKKGSSVIAAASSTPSIEGEADRRFDPIRDI